MKKIKKKRRLEGEKRPKITRKRKEKMINYKIEEI